MQSANIMNEQSSKNVEFSQTMLCYNLLSMTFIHIHTQATYIQMGPQCLQCPSIRIINSQQQ